MSDQFNLYLCKDKRLDVKPSVGYGVFKGAQSIYQNQYNATSQNTSSIVFNLQVPSENVLVCRRVMLTSQITLQLTNGYPITDWPAYYGYQEAFCPFPLHALMSNMTATINNCTVSTPMQDVLCILLRMMDQRELSMYEGGTPSFQDHFSSYQMGLVDINHNDYRPNDGLGSYSNAVQYEFVSRGSFKVDYLGTAPPTGTVGVLTKAAPPQVFYVQATFVEPLLLSPFTWGSNWDDPSLLGIQTMNFTFNIGSANRIWRSGTFFKDVNNLTTLTAVNNSKLLFTYLTPHPSDLISVRNSQPYYQIVPYKNQIAVSNGAVEQILNSNNFQLSCVPDKLFILFRPPISLCDMSVADVYAVIKKINIQWNANSGILNSATMYELWQMSQASGLAMSWLEWSGQFVAFTQGGQLAANWNTLYAMGLNSAGCGSACGSIAVFDMARFVQVVEDFYAPGSIGQFSLSMQVTVQAPLLTGLSDANQNWELVIAVMNSGFFTTEKGSSSVTLNILSKQDVLDASAMNPSYNQDLVRLVGGNFLSNLKSAVGNIYNTARSVVPVAAQVASLVDPKLAPYGQLANSINNLLPAYSGSGPMGGGEIGGRRRPSLRDRLRK